MSNTDTRIDQGPHISTERLVLRPYRPGDAEDLAAAANDPRIAENLRDTFPSPYTLEDALQWIAGAARRDPLEGLAITLDGRVIGGIGLTPNDDVRRFSAEVGCWLGVEHWDGGLMSEAMSAFCDHVFETTDLNRLEARVFETNSASGQMLQKAGFEREGVARKAAFRSGRFLDEELYALVRD